MCYLLSIVTVIYPLLGGGVPTTSKTYNTIIIYMRVFSWVRKMAYHQYQASNFIEADVALVAGRGMIIAVSSGLDIFSVSFKVFQY